MKVLTLKSDPDLVFEGITIVSEILGTIARGFVLDKMTNTIPNAFKVYLLRRERERERDGISSLIHCSGLLSFPSLLSVLPKALAFLFQNLDFIKENGKCVQIIFVLYWYTCMIPDL
ncbi:hypothetical protein CsSME_00037852 [Camellia sinensis var. sinensis]